MIKVSSNLKFPESMINEIIFLKEAKHFLEQHVEVGD